MGKFDSRQRQWVENTFSVAVQVLENNNFAVRAIATPTVGKACRESRDHAYPKTVGPSFYMAHLTPKQNRSMFHRTSSCFTLRGMRHGSLIRAMRWR